MQTIIRLFFTNCLARDGNFDSLVQSNKSGRVLDARQRSPADDWNVINTRQQSPADDWQWGFSDCKQRLRLRNRHPRGVTRRTSDVDLKARICKARRPLQRLDDVSQLLRIAYRSWDSSLQKATTWCFASEGSVREGSGAMIARESVGQPLIGSYITRLACIKIRIG